MRASTSTSVRFCIHARFGIGCVLGTREGDSGSITDLWFLDGKVRTILPAYLQDAAAELTKNQRQDLRAARSAYKKSRPKPLKRIALGFTKLTDKRNACSNVWHDGWDSSFTAGEPEENLELETEIESESQIKTENAA